MALNTGKLAGKTAFISGASRGIGKAIAVKLARDGANVVIAAKTAEPHPKLPGTIYTAAKEVEEAGGKALPCIVDIRDESSVQESVKNAVNTFGGIDILVNNASAISLTGTLATPMKKYDLMNGINARGTYLCSLTCLPYLKQAKNAHILNIAPPLNMKPIWFQNHTAYTMAKYGMSMCVLGMSEEFRPDGIAVNALWPRTTVATAAVEMLGGDELMKGSRTPEVMADAAYVMLTRNSRSYTGHFAVDDAVLAEVGVTDFDQYANVPGSTLIPDYFLDSAEDFYMKMSGRELQSTSSPSEEPASAAASDSGAGLSTGIENIFQKVEGLLNEDMTKKIKATYRFSFDKSGDPDVLLDLKNGAGSVVRNAPADMKTDVTMILKPDNFEKMFAGKLNPMTAFMTGKLKIKGDQGKALKLDKLMKGVQSKL